MRRQAASARAKDAEELYLAQHSLQLHAAAAKLTAEVSVGKAAAAEAVLAQQQAEEYNAPAAMLLESQQGTNAACNSNPVQYKRFKYCSRRTDTIAATKPSIDSGQFCHENQRSRKQRNAKMHSIATHAVS